MDVYRPPYALKAPGPSSPGSLRLPGREPFPRIDERLVEAEVTREEVIAGRRVVALPANAKHGDQHTQLDYVLWAHVAAGYCASVDLLTRHDQDSDFATDACVRQEGIDPATGTRYLEELAFEVVSEQREGHVTEKARLMHRRGVRRIFAVFVKKTRQVREWEPKTESWRRLAAVSRIADPCLVKPLPITALLDAAAADNAVIEALAAKGNPELRRREAAAKTEGGAETLLKFLAARGLAVSPAQQRRILRCESLAQLDLWISRALGAASTGEILAEP